MITGKNTQKLASVTGIAAGATSNLFQLGSDVAACFVYTNDAAATFVIQGRISPDAPWVTISSVITEVGANAGAQSVISRMLPEVRINATAGAGTVQVWVQA